MPPPDLSAFSKKSSTIPSLVLGGIPTISSMVTLSVSSVPIGAFSGVDTSGSSFLRGTGAVALFVSNRECNLWFPGMHTAG